MTRRPAVLALLAFALAGPTVRAADAPPGSPPSPKDAEQAAAAAALDAAGEAAYRRSDFGGALDAWQRSLKLAEARGDRGAAARSLLNIGSVHESRGDYSRSLDAAERALRLSEQIGDRVTATDALRALGQGYRTLGDPARALQLLERAVHLEQEIGDRSRLAHTLAHVGWVRLQLGELDEAFVIEKRVLALMEALGDRAGMHHALEALGSIERARGNRREALQSFEAALAGAESLGDRAGVARVLLAMAATHRQLGDSTRALELWTRGLAEAERLGAADLVFDALRALARAHLEHGDPKRSVKLSRRAVSHLSKLVAGLADEQGSTTRERLADVFEVGARAAAASGDTAEVAFFLESGRAMNLLESLGGRTALRSAVTTEGLLAEEAKARADLAAARARHDEAATGSDRAKIRDTLAAVAAAQARVVEASERIEREAKAATGLSSPTAVPLDDVRSSMNEGDALVLYGEDALALVVSRSRARVVPLRDARAIEEACGVEDWARLRTLVIDPLALGDGVRRLIVSPAGPLFAAPFCLLAPDLDVAYVPSASVYGALLEDVGKRGEAVLAVGDADFSSTSNGTPSFGRERSRPLVRLPATRREALAVGDVVLLGKEASEGALRTALATRPRWRALHLATHGLVDLEQPMLSALALSPDESDDGYLMAHEVIRTKISADLVVLAADKTARGRIVAGEGSIGLVRAFVLAGTPRVIASIWGVDDDASCALMTKFYERWNPRDGRPGVATATALRDAQRFVASHERWKAPRYWAGWQLWGLPD